MGVGRAGESGGGKWRQLYLNINFKRFKIKKKNTAAPIGG